MPVYSIGEIVWAKVKGYPWWPATISNIIESNKNEKIYHVMFICNNSYSFLQNRNICKYNEGYKNYILTKNYTLISSIKMANSILDNQQDNKIPTPLTSEKSKEINDEQGKSRHLMICNKGLKDNSLLNLKEDDIQRKISYYLIYIANSINKKEFQIVINDKKYIQRMLYFLRVIKLDDPIDFLKHSKIGKLVKYIGNNFPEDIDIELKQEFDITYKHLEKQLLAHLFQ